MHEVVHEADGLEALSLLLRAGFRHVLPVLGSRGRYGDGGHARLSDPSAQPIRGELSIMAPFRESSSRILRTLDFFP